MGTAYMRSYEEKMTILLLRAKSMAMELENCDIDKKEGVIRTTPDFFEIYDDFLDSIITMELGMELSQ